MGIDDKSKGTQVFWPGQWTVTVDCNVYFDKSAAVENLEGKDITIVEALPASVISSQNTQEWDTTSDTPTI